MAEEIKKVISIDTKSSSKSIKQLREEVADLTAELEDLEIGSSDYSQKLEELVDVQNRLGVATESMQGKTVNAVKAFDSINQVAGGLAGGVSAVSAAFTLFGKDTENLQKTMVKLQAAISIVQGIGGLKGLGEGILNGVKSFKALSVAMGSATASTGGLSVAMGVLRSAIISTGIGALVVALGMLIDFASKAASEIDVLSGSMQQLNASRERTSAVQAQINAEIAEQIYELDKLEAQGLLNKEERYKKEAKLYASAVAEMWDNTERQMDASNALSAILVKSTEGFFNFGIRTRKILKSLGSDLSTWKKALEMDREEATRYVLKFGEDVYQAYKNKNADFLKLLSEDDKKLLDKVIENEELRVSILDDYAQKRIDLNKKETLERLTEQRRRDQQAKDQYLKDLEARKKYNQDLLKVINDFYESNRKLLLDDEARELDELNRNYQNQLDALKEAYNLKLITTKEYNERLKQINEAYNKEWLENNNKHYREDLQNRLSALQEMQDRESQLFANKEAALSAQHTGSYETKVQQFGSTDFYQSGTDVQSQYQDTLAYNEQLYNLTKDRITRENELMAQQLEILKEQYNNKLITEQEYADQSQAIKLQQEANDIALSQAANAREEADLQAFKERQAKKQQAIQATMNVASSLSGALANAFKQEANDDSKSEKQREKSFKVYKALATTQAIIDTIISAQGAYKAMVGIPFVGPILAPIAAATAVIAGIANVKAIQNEQLPSSGGSGSNAGTTAPAALNTAPVEYTRNLLGNKETDELNQPVKCYVVESDITSVQTKVAVTEANASF